MTSSADLQFDQMEVNTKLAQEYIKSNNIEIHRIQVIKEDEEKNKNYFSNYSNKLPSIETRTLDYLRSLNNLADHIRENVDLFCQLEYLIRQKPVQTTTLELNMIIKHIHYHCSQGLRKLQVINSILMKDDSPLIDLGCIALLTPAADILATENTAFVCHLFTQLCHMSGLNCVKLGLLKKEDVKFAKGSNLEKKKVLEGGCIGVVTTQSDVESAVDVFLSAPKSDLWGIRRILVQESAGERFRSQIAWKTRSATRANVDPALESLCSDVYVHEDKIFLREYVGTETDLRNVVLVETFRTVKELLALIASYSPFCVSLWSHGAAESNEIAYSIAAPMVWVNRHGVLSKPSRVAMAYYSQILLGTNENNPEFDRVRKLQKDWAKLTSVQRQMKVFDILKGVPKFDFLYAEFYTGNFVHVDASDLVVGVQKPRDLYAIKWELDMRPDDILNCLLDGSGLLISLPAETDPDFRTLLTRFGQEGLPVLMRDFGFPADTFPLPQTTRVVHSSFGTIFAN